MPEGQGGAFDQQKPGHGNWHELILPDPAKGIAFYGKLFGWTLSRSVPMGPDMTYHIMARAGLEIGGTCAFPDTPPHWKPYFGLTSAKAAVTAVTSAGGTFTVQIKDAQGIPLALVGPA